MSKINAPYNSGTVIAIRGSVVDILFAQQLPSIRTLLTTGDKGQIFAKASGPLVLNE